MIKKAIKIYLFLLFFACLIQYDSRVAPGQPRGSQPIPQRQYYRPVIDIPLDIPRRSEIVNKYDQAIRLLNNPLHPLTSQQIEVLNKVQGIMVVADVASDELGTNPILRIYSSGPDSVLKSSVNWLATTIIHEGTHLLLYDEGGYCKTMGEEAERTCLLAQLALAQNIGLESYNVNFLNTLLSNPITYHRTQRPGGRKMIFEKSFLLPALFNIETIEGVSIKQGDSVFICADGEMSFGPMAGRGNADGLYKPASRYQNSEDCFNPRIPHGAVIFRINPGDLDDEEGWGRVGVPKTHKGFDIIRGGQLQVGFNDRDNMNNIGLFTLRIMVVR